MPYRKKAYRKKKSPIKKKVVKRAIVPRAIRPRTYTFKRDIEQTLAFTSVPPEGWTSEGNGIYTHLAWSLGNLGNITDFQNLFKQYKIVGARVKMYFSQTQSGSDGSHFDNAQLICRMAANQSNLTPALTVPYFQQLQRKKYRTCLNGGRPLDFYIPLKIQSEIQSSTYTAPAMVKPRWIDTTITNVPHSGMLMRIDRADGQGFTSGSGNQQYCKMITTLYLVCRGVQ